MTTSIPTEKPPEPFLRALDLFTNMGKDSS